MADTAVAPDPTVHRRRLRNELRKARENAGMTQRDVAAAMDWSQSKLIRIETGQVNISTNDLRALLNHYGAESPRIEVMVELARASRETPRWNIYRDVAPPEFIAFLGYESSASVIRNFEPLLIPGLLQTEDYARAVTAVIEAENPQRVDALVDMRMQRQEIFFKKPAPSVHFIIDEAVVHRTVGGPEIMQQQLRHLREVSDYENVKIRMVPFTMGIYPHIRAPYVLFEFPDPADEAIVYMERVVEGYLTDVVIKENSPQEMEKYDTSKYLETFWKLEQLARREDFPGFIDGLLRPNEVARPPRPSGPEAV
jgi:transcriptional regulator with XRE-family HTH domain